MWARFELYKAHSDSLGRSGKQESTLGGRYDTQGGEMSQRLKPEQEQNKQRRGDTCKCLEDAVDRSSQE